LGKLSVLAEYKDDLQITLGLAKDYTATATAAATWNNTQIVALADETSRLQLSLRPRHQRGQSQRVRITTAEGGTVTTGEGALFHALTCEVGIYGGLPRAEAEGKA
jgi:Flp pilus assembly protein CpaB